MGQDICGGSIGDLVRRSIPVIHEGHPWFKPRSSIDVLRYNALKNDRKIGPALQFSNKFSCLCTSLSPQVWYIT
jgi:hypothetical protein